MKRNTDPTFVGLQILKLKQVETLAKFRLWSDNKWQHFHSNHFDWWMFPIDEPSTTFRLQFTVYEDDVRELRSDVDYLSSYRESLELIALSWGWDLQNAKPLSKALPEQSWHNWAIRLYKVTRSAQLFNETEAFESLRQYGLSLLNDGFEFRYYGDPSKDLVSLFRTKSLPTVHIHNGG